MTKKTYEFLGITDESIANEAERIGRDVDPDDPAHAVWQLAGLFAHYIRLKEEGEGENKREHEFTDLL